MKQRFIFYSSIICLVFISNSCTKQDKFLEEKPDASLIVPSTLNDFQLLLNNESVFNFVCDPSLGAITAEEYYVTTSVWNALTIAKERNAYIWAPDIWQGATGSITGDWNKPYQQVYYANVILDGLKKINPTPDITNQYNQIKGSALFFRAKAFYNLVTIFAKTFDSTTSNTDLGIVLRLDPDFNETSRRSTVKETYDQIIKDLSEALVLLPLNNANKLQPSKTVVNGFLARIYLSMRIYDKALQHASAMLDQFNTLVDYNMVTPGASSITNSNTFFPEVLFHTTMSNPFILVRTRAIVDSNLYKLYSANDLRKSDFFTTLSGQIRFRGTYDYKGNGFSGLATDELYLIRAECYARKGDVTAAMNDLNTLLRKRWKKDLVTGLTLYVDQTATSPSDALNKILLERRKELCFRGLRLSDLKRLNLEGFNISLTRIINGQTYILPPNSPLYILPIPPDEIRLSGLQQNPR